MTSDERTITRRNYGRNHGYKDHTGEKVKGVTSWIGDGIPKSGLIRWAASQAAGYAVDHWDELSTMSVSQRLAEIMKHWQSANKEALRKGTDIHALAERMLAGETVEPPDHLLGYVDAYLKFLDDFEVEPLISEGIVANLSVWPAYAGTFDLLARLKDEQTWLIDVKTGNGVYGEVGLQLAAYRNAEFVLDEQGKPTPMPTVDQCAVLHLRSDTYSLRPVRADEDVFTAFRYAQMTALTVDQSRDWLGEEIRA